MCGIVGLLARGLQPVTAGPVLLHAAESLRSRGPDDGGVWTEDGVALAHRRLAIIDVSSAGHQPMASEDGRLVIVFNGEIYNFMEIRNEIYPDGHAWRSNSDTEVVLAAYRKWGKDCLSRFNGMFAFAIWDRDTRTLFAARDRMGVKPLYYHHSPARFAFASRPRALFRLCEGLSDEIDEQALRFYLEAGYVPAPYSIYREIRQLPPGHWLILRDHKLSVGRYWDFRHIAPERRWENRREEDLLDELDELISRSVRLRMVSDVPIGAFLSGGIDSSLVVAMMARHSASSVKTFTIGFDEQAYDESSHAAAVAKHLSTDHHCEQLRVDDLLDLMPTFVDQYDEPFFDSSAFPTMAVSRLARRFVTVSLSGDGGDELFGGYHYYQIAQGLTPFLRLPRSVRSLAASTLGAFPSHRMKLLAGALRQESATSIFAFSRSIAKDFAPLLTDDVIRRTVSIHELFAETARGFPEGLSAAETGMRLDASLTLPSDYLQKVDVGSMAFSLESREPLLDYTLVEWAMRLPLSWKLRAGTNKYLLRKLAYRYVPAAILDRPKQGFGVPIDRWLRGPLKGWAEDLLHDERQYEILKLKKRDLQELFRLHLSAGRNTHPLLWASLVLQQYFRTTCAESDSSSQKSATHSSQIQRQLPCES